MSRRAALRSCLLAAAFIGVGALPVHADLASRYSAHQQQADALRSRIQAADSQIQGYEGSIASLQARLAAVNRSVAVQEALLGRVRTALSAARAELAALEARYAYGRRVLAAQLLADYETPPPTMVGVIAKSAKRTARTMASGSEIASSSSSSTYRLSSEPSDSSMARENPPEPPRFG